MATTLTTIYPPQVGTFMPSFCYNGSAKIWFNISSYDEEKIYQIQYLHVSMIDQRNNRNVFAGKSDNVEVYPQYYPVIFNGDKEGNNNANNKMGYDPDKKMYWVQIPPQLLKTAPYYNPGQYYKAQLRFDLTGSTNFEPSSASYADPTDFFYWDSASSNKADSLKLATYTAANANNFSEWSTGTLLKPILIPTLGLQQFNTSTTKNTNPSTDVPVAGQLTFTKANGDNNIYTETEHLSWYKIQVLNNSKTIVHYDTDKIYPNDGTKISINEINYRIDVSKLTINTNYQMRIIYETNNGYRSTTDYPIKVIDYKDNTEVTCNKYIDEDIGVIGLNILGFEKYENGYIIVRRSSHYSNFQHWDLIAAYNITGLNSINIVDNTVESMTGYRYQIQYIKDDATIYRPIYVENDDILHCDFYGGLLSDGEKTLNITFDLQFSNRTNAVNKAKTDTLGGRYPIFSKNAQLKYHIYSISGTISTEDNGELFLPKEEVFGTEYYNKRYNLQPPAPHNSECQAIKPHKDWLYEREYRDAVEEWLDNGKPKLFRSMTEGNIIVMLDTVSMIPNVTLGRRLYSFSATMYEIGNGKDINSIASLGLFDIIDQRVNDE